jgi:hypothetical protein
VQEHEPRKKASLNLIDARVVAGIVGAAAALIGSLVGGLLSMWAATRAHRRQLELQDRAFVAERELKARELMFGVYQTKAEEFNSEIKALGGVIAQMSMAMNLTDIEEADKNKALVAFVGAIATAADPLINKLELIEEELNSVGLLKKWEKEVLFVKSQLTPKLSQMTPAQATENYKELAKALALITAIQHELVQRKSLELFEEYLPKKPVAERI